MADFYQNGDITTLHNLGDRSLEDLESDLVKFSKTRPMSLLLPSLYSELETEALPNIIEHLKKVPYLSEIVVGLDRANESEYRHALNVFKVLPQHHRVLWQDGPRLRAIDDELKEKKLAPNNMGKGRNVWYCLGYIYSSNRSEAIALHDCDITTYNRSMLARLIYPVANPNFNYEFCKGYYARLANQKINGRVSRLLVTPLIRSLKKVVGPSSYLDYMDSFRYSLAGEFSFRRDVISAIRIPSDWGLEIGVLSEVFRNYSNHRLCQVDIADNYDHKHQQVSFDDVNSGLSKMSVDIIKSLFRKLATQGEVLSAETFRTIKATYFRLALDFVERYENVSIINGLEYDVHKEESTVELFAENIIKASEAFLNKPLEYPFIPCWNRVASAIPDIFERLKIAVDEDTKEFMS